MAGLIVILLYACKLAFLASSTCVKIIEFSLKNEARKAYLHVHKRIIIMPAIMKEVYNLIYVDQVGTYSELLQNEGAFSEFLKTFGSEQNAEEDGM